MGLKSYYAARHILSLAKHNIERDITVTREDRRYNEEIETLYIEPELRKLQEIKDALDLLETYDSTYKEKKEGE